ncbi:uncharacterized protein Tco025E_00108 [Trypanosoma conorhini]|uniref:Secreted protein n=1 Tax=Trypanosoma conorhini TaxID=83891 RepID=A0A422QCN6_9TRYP|nr:uncharacterized protein Tco025E_00108 [Trypanosoma conorhini]RNF27724.1 hypothetical protein Tco025E_00108 [Trypanosoma conorhini]
MIPFRGCVLLAVFFSCLARCTPPPPPFHTVAAQQCGRAAVSAKIKGKRKTRRRGEREKRLREKRATRTRKSLLSQPPETSDECDRTYVCVYIYTRLCVRACVSVVVVVGGGGNVSGAAHTHSGRNTGGPTAPQATPRTPYYFLHAPQAEDKRGRERGGGPFHALARDPESIKRGGGTHTHRQTHTNGENYASPPTPLHSNADVHKKAESWDIHTH